MLDLLLENLLVVVFENLGLLCISLIKGAEKLVHEVYAWHSVCGGGVDSSKTMNGGAGEGDRGQRDEG